MQTKLTRTDDLMHYLEGKYLVYFHDAELYYYYYYYYYYIYLFIYNIYPGSPLALAVFSGVLQILIKVDNFFRKFQSSCMLSFKNFGL